jgi:hypothetical protein
MKLNLMSCNGHVGVVTLEGDVYNCETKTLENEQVTEKRKRCISISSAPAWKKCSAWNSTNKIMLFTLEKPSNEIISFVC